MNLSQVASRTQRFVSDNSPALLTAVGVTGTIATAVLTGQASYKACLLINGDRDTMPGGDPTTRENFELCWKLYIPPVVVGAATIACVVGANRVGARRASALAAAYSLSEKAFVEYKEKVATKLTAAKEDAVRTEIAQERLAGNPPTAAELLFVTDGKVLCYDQFTDRYFQSDMESLRRAENDINFQINNNFYASLTDYYSKVGLGRTQFSDDVGWNSDKQLKVHYTTALAPNGVPCISLEFMVEPIRGYSRVH